MNALQKFNILTLVASALILPAVATIVSASDKAPESSRYANSFVYTMTNQTTGNKVVVFDRRSDGTLSKISAFATGGKGTSTPLGNQYGLRLDPAGRCLYAVNAGSNDISSFLIQGRNLKRVTKIASGGFRPVSIAVYQNTLYVANAGGSVGQSDNVSGFTVGKGCKLSNLGNSTKALSAANTAPAQVEFSPDGKRLIVTEKATNKIDTFAVSGDGRLSNLKVLPSVGTTPFGFEFGKDNQLFVSEAASGNPGQGTVSSYALKDDGTLKVLSSAVPTTETATCWIAISKNERFAYAVNTGSQSISGFAVSPGGRIKLIDADGRTGVTAPGTAPVDAAFSRDGRFLYVVDEVLGNMTTFRINTKTGNLRRIQVLKGLPAGSLGLAVR
jgi:6-phosphogluconolactonase (cycloisomerase 2 family)